LQDSLAQSLNGLTHQHQSSAERSSLEQAASKKTPVRNDGGSFFVPKFNAKFGQAYQQGKVPLIDYRRKRTEHQVHTSRSRNPRIGHRY
jgi:hypothetical protein